MKFWTSKKFIGSFFTLVLLGAGFGATESEMIGGAGAEAVCQGAKCNA